MARDTATRRRSTESRLVFTILGVTVWIATGFLVGLVAGVISEEPQLLAGHLTGQDTEVEWDSDGDVGTATDAIDVAAAPHPLAPLSARAQAEDEPIPSLERSNGPSLTEAPAVVPVSARPQKNPGRDLPPARPAVSGPGYLIQVGAYSSRGAAQEVAETLRGKGYAVEVLSAADDGRFRVRVGPVAARDRAEGLAKRLEDDEGLPTWILRAQES